jgi:hypothetical protein
MLCNKCGLVGGGILLLAAAVVIIVLLFSGSGVSGGGNDSSIVGTWVYQRSGVGYTFRADGTWVFHQCCDIADVIDSGTYEIDGVYIRLNDGGAILFSVSRDRLTFFGDLHYMRLDNPRDCTACRHEGEDDE